MRLINITLLLILFPCWLSAGTRIISYGFEDWTGSFDTTPGMVYSSSASKYWADFTGSNIITSDCGSRSAYAGTYYQHRAFDTDTEDACLGGAPASINDHGNIGYNGAYPNESGDSTQLSTAVTSDTIVFRCYIRFVGNWKTATWTGIPQCKFFRIYGTGGTTDPASAEVVMRWDSVGGFSADNPSFTIYDPAATSSYDGGGAYGTFSAGGADIFDGGWHSVAIVTVRNADDNSAGNVTQSIYIDDWGMGGTPAKTRTITCSSFGSAYNNICMFQNFSAVYPNEQLGIDTDSIEVWDGLPNSPSTITASGTAVWR